jgi:hypothetical protein
MASILPMTDEIRRAEAEDDAEEWARSTGEPDVRDVGAWTDEEVDGWVVDVPVQEFFRQDPLGVDLRQRMRGPLLAVQGVTDVSEHDNESWFVEGSPSGEALTRAAANVVDEFADRLRDAMQG